MPHVPRSTIEHNAWSKLSDMVRKYQDAEAGGAPEFIRNMLAHDARLQLIRCQILQAAKRNAQYN
jgi:hypothetical protein